MDLSLSEEQSELVATVRSVLDKRADSRAVRAAVAAAAARACSLSASNRSTSRRARTWSVTSKTTIGSLAAPGGSSSVAIASPTSMTHLLGSGTVPSSPSHGKVGVTGT